MHPGTETRALVIFPSNFATLRSSATRRDEFVDAVYRFWRLRRRGLPACLPVPLLPRRESRPSRRRELNNRASRSSGYRVVISILLLHPILRRETVRSRYESKPSELVGTGRRQKSTCFPPTAIAVSWSRLISLQIAFYILEIVLGMLLPVVIHNARNIRPGQRPTKASFNHRPRGTAVTFPSLSGIQKANTAPERTTAPRSPRSNYVRYFLSPAEIPLRLIVL